MEAALHQRGRPHDGHAPEDGHREGPGQVADWAAGVADLPRARGRQPTVVAGLLRRASGLVIEETGLKRLLPEKGQEDVLKAYKES